LGGSRQSEGFAADLATDGAARARPIPKQARAMSGVWGYPLKIGCGLLPLPACPPQFCGLSGQCETDPAGVLSAPGWGGQLVCLADGYAVAGAKGGARAARPKLAPRTGVPTLAALQRAPEESGSISRMVTAKMRGQGGRARQAGALISVWQGLCTGGR
jgi:hypothetical protein